MQINENILPNLDDSVIIAESSAIRTTKNNNNTND